MKSAEAGTAIKETIASWDARHGAAVFLILYALVGLDVMSIQDPAKRQAAVASWTPWAITFILLGFFIIGPEQDAIMAQSAAR